jgi:hypothetical protein
MTTTITGADAHVPTLLTTFGWTRASRNIITRLAGSSDIVVALRPAGARRGRFSAVFSDKAAAIALEAELALAQSLTIEDTDHGDLDMTFVLAGSLEIQLDPQTRRNWIVTWEFQEVTG